jgi:hypothetical protein
MGMAAKEEDSKSFDGMEVIVFNTNDEFVSLAEK